MTDKVPAKRTPKGQFVAGQSGNPAGRAKGTKNKITLARLMLEDQLRETLAREGPKLMKKAVAQALKGNDRIMRVLLDKMLTTPKDQDSGESADRDIKVTVQNLIPSQQPSPTGRLIEGGSVRIPVTIPLPEEVKK